MLVGGVRNVPKKEPNKDTIKIIGNIYIADI
jgi:hypothetical protein